MSSKFYQVDVWKCLWRAAKESYISTENHKTKLNLKCKEMNESECMGLTIEEFHLILPKRYDFLQYKETNSKSLSIKSNLKQAVNLRKWWHVQENQIKLNLIKKEN